MSDEKRFLVYMFSLMAAGIVMVFIGLCLAFNVGIALIATGAIIAGSSVAIISNGGR